MASSDTQAGRAREAGTNGTGEAGGYLAPETAARMAAAARALLGAVTGEQRTVLNPGFDDFDLVVTAQALDVPARA